jgi:hypothetical protein
VNGAPAFVADPFSVPDVVAGQNYSGTIASNALDPNPSDTLAFSKLTGPVWLNLTSNGTLSGTPLSPDVGTNVFVVRVNDSQNLSATATMTVSVLAATPIVASLAVQTNQLLLTWTGGIGPYQVQQATTLDNPDWQNAGPSISGSTTFLTPTNMAAFYRVSGR